MDAFGVAAHPIRRKILDLLALRPRNAGEIASAFPNLTQPGVSRHLKILRDAHAVDVTVNAQQRIYALNPKGLAEIYEWVAKYQAMWPETLDALEHYLNADAVQEKARKGNP